MNRALTIGTRSSAVVEQCQVCESPDLEKVIFLGYLPPVNSMPVIGTVPREQPSYPALVLRCRRCELVQLGLIVDPQILFPPEYPYTSGTTKILRDNFREMSEECRTILSLTTDDLVVDIGSNDGTLLSNFADRHRVHGIEPSEQGNLANSRGIPTTIAFFTPDIARKVAASEGKAKVITATNVFAHIEDVHSVVDGIVALLADDGVFISESHYLLSLLETVQYDTIYHEHLRYYSLHSLRYLLRMHDLEVIYAKRIPTHGGSIRVYAARRGKQKVRSSVDELLRLEESSVITQQRLDQFRSDVVLSKLGLYSLLDGMKRKGARIFGVGAPSRASTLINHVGLDENLLDCVVEVANSQKVGKYIPGTLIPVVDEAELFSKQPEYALLLSWHIADELIPKLKARGFRGSYIVPLPQPRVVSG